MAITKETELKTMLPAAVASKMLTAYPWQAAFTQTNSYYDTVTAALKNANSALRIRSFADYAEQTLKVRSAEVEERRITEFTDRLTLPQAAELITQQRILAGATVTSELTKLQVNPDALHVFASLKTIRRQCPLAAGLLVLDHSFFSDGTDDWELEIEYTDRAAAAAVFAQISTRFAFTISSSVSKIARASAHTPGR
jgi:uncharacterized protein YjbK